MMGAPCLSALAVLRSGSGLSHLYYHEKYKEDIRVNVPDIMIGTYNKIDEVILKKDAVIFGPGLGKKDVYYNKKTLSTLLDSNIPLVIDADGLHYFKDLMDDYKVRENIVLTPHLGEFENMLNRSIKNEYDEVNRFTKKYNFTLLLKGSTTLISSKGITYFSSLGTPALAVAGSGDVLTGIIASFLGNGYSSLNAAKLGVYIHSKAGILCERELGEYSVIASDLINKIPHVLKELDTNV